MCFFWEIWGLQKLKCSPGTLPIEPNGGLQIFQWLRWDGVVFDQWVVWRIRTQTSDVWRTQPIYACLTYMKYGKIRVQLYIILAERRQVGAITISATWDLRTLFLKLIKPQGMFYEFTNEKLKVLANWSPISVHSNFASILQSHNANSSDWQLAFWFFETSDVRDFHLSTISSFLPFSVTAGCFLEAPNVPIAPPGLTRAVPKRLWAATGGSGSWLAKIWKRSGYRWFYCIRWYNVYTVYITYI